MTRPRSSAAFERAKAVIPGGVNSPVRAFKGVGGSPVFVSEADGLPVHGPRWKPLHRLRDVVGAADSRARGAGRPRGDR